MSHVPRRAVVALVAVLLLVGCQGQQVDVTGSAPEARVEAYEAMSEQALTQTEDLWGEGSVERPVRVVLPGSAAEFDALTGGAASSKNAPAVTVGSLPKAHIVVHPDSWELLTPEGRQAVLTHEVTHLSMQGHGPVPAWLGEGLAEYTAHRSSALMPTTIAGSALDRVRSGDLPASWPAPQASTGQPPPPQRSTTNVWGGYAMSWLACRYIADAWSEEALIDFYEEAASGVPLADAFETALGTTEADALHGWQVWLEALVADQ